MMSHNFRSKSSLDTQKTHLITGSPIVIYYSSLWQRKSLFWLNPPTLKKKTWFDLSGALTMFGLFWFLSLSAGFFLLQGDQSNRDFELTSGNIKMKLWERESLQSLGKTPKIYRFCKAGPSGSMNSIIGGEVPEVVRGRVICQLELLISTSLTLPLSSFICAECLKQEAAILKRHACWQLENWFFPLESRFIFHNFYDKDNFASWCLSNIPISYLSFLPPTVHKPVQKFRFLMFRPFSLFSIGNSSHQECKIAPSNFQFKDTLNIILLGKRLEKLASRSSTMSILIRVKFIVIF